MNTAANKGMVISIASVTSGTISNADGYKLLLAMKQALAAQPETVAICLLNVTGFSSSFLNSSFGALFEEQGPDSLKRLRLTNYKPAQLKQIKEYMVGLTTMHHS